MWKQNWSRWFPFCQRRRSSEPRGTGTETMHWRYLGRDAVHRKDYIDQCQSQHHQEERRHLQWVDPWDSKIGMGDTPNSKAACWRQSSLSSSTQNLPCGFLWPFLEPSCRTFPREPARFKEGSGAGFRTIPTKVPGGLQTERFSNSCCEPCPEPHWLRSYSILLLRKNSKILSLQIPIQNQDFRDRFTTTLTSS